MNYYDLFQIEPSFYIDAKNLRKKYLEKSKTLHPDLLAEDGIESIQDAAFLNDAYATLTDFFSNLKYMLHIHGIASDSKNAPLSADFLMEMMDINEEIADCIGDNRDTDKIEQIRSSLKDYSLALQATYEPLLKKYGALSQENNDVVLLAARDYLLKSNYIKRSITMLDNTVEM